MNPNPINRLAVEDLATGDHVSDAQGVHEVMHRFAFRNGDGRPAIALTLRPLGQGEPWVARHPEGHRLTRATDDEVLEFHDASRRLALATALHQLANDIVDKRLPLPNYTLHIGGVVESRRELERWALYLHGKVEMGGTGDDIPVIRVTRDVPGGPSLAVGMQSAAEPEPACDVKVTLDEATRAVSADPDVEVHEPPVDDTPEADQPWHFTFGSGLLYDGRYVVINGTSLSARERMVEVFGRAWCAQYSRWEFTTNSALAGLVELPESEWPPVVADEDDDATPTQQAGR